MYTFSSYLAFSWWTGLFQGLRKDRRVGGWDMGNAFVERIVKPVCKNGPPLTFTILFSRYYVGPDDPDHCHYDLDEGFAEYCDHAQEYKTSWNGLLKWIRRNEEENPNLADKQKEP